MWRDQDVVASELNAPICHSDECQIGSFSDDVGTISRYGLVYLHA